MPVKWGRQMATKEKREPGELERLETTLPKHLQPIPSIGPIVSSSHPAEGASPGLAILLTVLGLNLLGDWLRDSLDPTGRTSR